MLRLVVADRVSRALRQEADVRRNHEFFNGRNVARTPLSTAGQFRSLTAFREENHRRLLRSRWLSFSETQGILSPLWQASMNGKTQVFSSGVVAALGAALLFGASTPLAKMLLRDVNPWLLAGLFYLGSGIGLTLWRVLTRAAPVRLSRGETGWLAGAILSGGVVGPVLLMFGLTGMPASGAALLLNAEGVFTALLAWVVFKENFDHRIALGMGSNCRRCSGAELARRGSVCWCAASLGDTGGLLGMGHRQQSDAQGLSSRRNMDCSGKRHGCRERESRARIFPWRPSA